MTACLHRFGLLLVLLWPVLPASAQSQSAAPDAQIAGMALVEALRDGGYNLYFRHAATVWSQQDRVATPADWTSCDPARVRQLSAAGLASARAVGQAIRRLAVPVGAVFASPYCRTRRTAEALELGPVKSTADILNLRVADLAGGRDRVVAAARARLASRPENGRNNVYVAHGNLAIQVTGVYPGEGESLVFKPLGEDFEYVGRLPPAQWLDLAGLADPSPPVVD